MFALFSLRTDRKSCIAMGNHPELGEDMASMVVEIFREQADPKNPEPIFFGACDHGIAIDRKAIGAYHGIFENNTVVEVRVPSLSLLIMVDFNNLARFTDYTGDELGGYSEECGMADTPELEDSTLTALKAIHTNKEKDQDHVITLVHRRTVALALPDQNDSMFREPSPSL